MKDEEIEKFAVATTGELLKLKARCNALEITFEAVAIKLGLDQTKVRNMVQSVTEAVYQVLLERAENVDPGLAAQIDERKEFPDLSGDYLL